MSLFLLGGPMMWPLLAASILALAIIFERIWVAERFTLPADWATTTPPGEILAALTERPAFAHFHAELTTHEPDPDAVTLAGELVVADMEKHLGLLRTTAKLATMMGLLGTIFGMISTFSTVAASTSGVDMTALAEGLWQALITTATGLVIALPSFFAAAIFEARAAATARALTVAATVCTRKAPS